MLCDKVRVQAFEKALRQLVGPTTRLLEIGGGTGYFSCLAAKLGASDVHCVEFNPIIELGPPTATKNNLEVHFYKCRSQEVELDPPCNLLLHDMRGLFPIFDGTLSAIVDARQRLLSPKAIFLPKADTVFCSLIEDKETFEQFTDPWPLLPGDLELAHLPDASIPRHRYAVNNKARIWDKIPVCHLDYSAIQDQPIESSIAWQAEKSGVSHGLVFWFDCHLTDDISFTTNPWQDQFAWIYGNAFLSWSKPILIEKDQTYQIKVGISVAGTVGASISLGDTLMASRSSHSNRSVWGSTRVENEETALLMQAVWKEIVAQNSPADALQTLLTQFPSRTVSELSYSLHQCVRQAGGAKLAEGVTATVACQGVRIEVISDDPASLQRCLSQLQPSWSLSEGPAELRLQVCQCLSETGLVHFVSEDSQNGVSFGEFEAALAHFQASALRILASNLSQGLALDLGCLIQDNGACVIVGAQAQRQNYLTNSGKVGCWQALILHSCGGVTPYHTGSANAVVSVAEPYRVAQVCFVDPLPVSRGLAAAQLMARILPNRHQDAGVTARLVDWVKSAEFVDLTPK